jgi:hypothetical protein
VVWHFARCVKFTEEEEKQSLSCCFTTPTLFLRMSSWSIRLSLQFSVKRITR